MKILFVTDLYPIGEENIARALFYFVQEWQKQGHEVEVIRSNYIFNTILRGRKIVKEKIYYEQGTKIYNINFHTPFLFNVYNKLPKDFSLKNYDVIISHMPCGALMASKLLKRNRIKYVCAVHNSDIVVLKKFKYILFRNLLKNAYKKADKIAARSPILQTKIEEILPNTQNKTFVAYSGIDNNLIKEKIEEKIFNQDKVQISTVASLIKRKNIDIVIKSLSMIPDNFHYTIIGDGNQRNKLEKLSNKLGLSKKITFTGKLSRENVIEKLQESDIFILLSKNETFGISYLEAMATGNIVIAKENDGIDGIIQNEQNGFLIKANPLELKRCLESIFALKETEIEKIQQQTNNTIKNLTASKAAENYLKNII